MVFKDYYAILGVPKDSNFTQIRKSYLRLVKKWHPDRNKGTDTTAEMQEIVEAYLILSDLEARGRYDAIYNRYREEEPKQSNANYSTTDDSTLERWMMNARHQSIKIAQELMSSTGHFMKIGLKAAVNEVLPFKLF